MTNSCCSTLKKYAGPVVVSFVVFKKVLRGDEHNLTVAFDKIVLDNITAPKGNKRRGLSWIRDDSPKYMTLLPPEIRKGLPERTLVQIYKRLDQGGQ
jgi:hypothetical protein